MHTAGLDKREDASPLRACLRDRTELFTCGGYRPAIVKAIAIGSDGRRFEFRAAASGPGCVDLPAMARPSSLDPDGRRWLRVPPGIPTPSLSVVPLTAGSV